MSHETLFYYCGVTAGMADQARILVSGVALVDHAVDAFATDVSIFANTLAREIPTKVQAIAEALKAHTNVELSDITDYTNASWNTVLTDMQKFAGDVAKEHDGYLDGFRETIQIGGFPVTKVYNVITDENGLIEAIEDITEE
jgi:hypothetical protein